MADSGGAAPAALGGGERVRELRSGLGKVMEGLISEEIGRW